jgi:hypothetical protein
MILKSQLLSLLSCNTIVIGEALMLSLRSISSLRLSVHLISRFRSQYSLFLVLCVY